MTGSFSKCLEKLSPSRYMPKNLENAHVRAHTHTHTKSSFTEWINKRKTKVNPQSPERTRADLSKACSI